MPSATACLIVSMLLTLGAGLVAGFPRRAPRLGRLGAAGAAGLMPGLMSGLMPEQRVAGEFAR